MSALGVVQNCQHLWKRTESTLGGWVGGVGGGLETTTIFLWIQHLMLITDNKSTFYSTGTLLGRREGGPGKEYSLYAFVNVNKFERPLNLDIFACCHSFDQHFCDWSVEIRTFTLLQGRERLWTMWEHHLPWWVDLRTKSATDLTASQTWM